jgi:Ca2+-binding RTX toxin-like protein
MWMNVTRRRIGIVALLQAAMLMLPSGAFMAVAHAAPAATPAPVGQGFTILPADLAFILQQIKVAERHVATYTSANPCGTLVGPGPDQIPDPLTPYGLRTVDGSCNNLFPGRDTFAAADQPFPRLTTPVFRAAETTPAGFGPPAPTSYAQKTGNVFDSQPRVVSNLIVDQTSTNPAAVAAAGFPVRTQGNPGVFPCTTDPDPTANPPAAGVPANCVPSHQTLFIPNVTTDVGLSPPYNSLFTFFGQFFDHGLDQTVKSGGAVFVPLAADDPLVAGPDHIFGNADDLPMGMRFMVLTRAQNQPGPDGIMGTADDIQNAPNTDTPWVDQSQTYASHASHQVFLREYVPNASGKPISTGRLLGGPPGPNATGMATWASLKAQAATLLGLQLVDTDVTSVPMMAADPYGRFVPGPNGLPQYVTRHGLVEGDLANPVPVPADVLHFDTPFITDIAHNADPSPVDTDNNPATPPIAPVPDADKVASADFAHQPAGTYDDELLNAHFVAGDGRVNENIALTAIHQVFHSEHDRLVDDIKNVLSTDTTPSGVAALAEWQLAAGAAGWNGERLFQAARFVNEMEYQHIAFGEFARKVQPAVRVFHGYQPDLQPAIKAEFAQAVYRFGHSMLDENVARTNVDPASGAQSDNSIPLLHAFLNPPEYFNAGGICNTPPCSTAGLLTPERAAGSIVMGSSDQVGNELDEFVTETLRNNLLGLPLDLATLNLTRARETGIPPLNAVRRQLFAATNDGQLTPYSSWNDFGQHLKHPESLVNFVAAYGKHPTITAQSTLAGKRAAAKAIVAPNTAPATAPGLIPADAAAFVAGTGGWANVAGVTTTGVDDVELWVGGLAEVTPVFGGLLGSTFNYVFQTQMENLQDGDRLYYLARTAGLNLQAQLEGNSLAQLIERNTDGTNTLKADAFATADCKFQLANLAGTPEGYAKYGSVVADDPATACDESKLLMRTPDGTIQYRQTNTVDRPGRNGQSVYNGTPGADRVVGGTDSDTIWGGAGNDVIDGGGGNDVIFGGAGNDIITDASGANILAGGPGNDAVAGGTGNDLILGGDGQDFTNGGGGDNETFGGPGNDFVIAGQGANTVFGGPGDDWMQGGPGVDVFHGDNGAPFLNDPGQVTPGNDIMIGQSGQNTYDAEGGDDLMAASASVDRFAGAAGFDWAFHQYDTVAANDDMLINNSLNGPVIPNRDIWQETEAISGSAFNDVIRGDNTVPSAVGGAGFTGCDVLDQAGVDRIQGLAALLPPLTGDASSVAAISMTGSCPLSGPYWGAGNILLGGAGSDTIEGRGGNDIIDGASALQTRISVRTIPADPASEIGSADLMEHQYRHTGPALDPVTGEFNSANLTGPTLQQDVFNGTIDPGNLVAVREIIHPAKGSSIDTAVFSGPRSNYTVTSTPATATAPLKLTVTQTGANVAGQKVSDGTDTLFNIDVLKFSDQTAAVKVPDPPTIGTATAINGAAKVTWTAPAANGGPAITGYEIVATSTAGGQSYTQPVGPKATSGTILLFNGTTYTLQVRAINMAGPGPLSAASNLVTPAGPPSFTQAVTAKPANASANLQWTAPTTDGGSPITGYQIQVRAGKVLVRTDITIGTATTALVAGLTNGTAYRFTVRAVNAVGAGVPSLASNTVVPAAAPDPPVLGAVTPGSPKGPLTVTVNWTPPAVNGGAAITGYQVSAHDSSGNLVQPPLTVGSAARSKTLTFATAGWFTFDVIATNAAGNSAPSTESAPTWPQ